MTPASRDPDPTDAEKDAEKAAERLASLQQAIGAMTAIGYVDRVWVQRSFLEYLAKEQSKKPKPESRARSPLATLGGWLIAILRFLLSWIPGVGAQPRSPIDRVVRGGRVPAHDVLKLVLARVPGQVLKPRFGDRGPAPASLGSRLSRYEAEDIDLVVKFLRASGLEEAGFPVRFLGEADDRPLPSAASADNQIPPAVALSTLTGGLLYRFAYDSDGPLKWDDASKVFRSSGVYRIYVCPPGQSYAEQRLLFLQLDKGGSIVRAAEVRNRAGYDLVRGGYVVPSNGANTVILSSDFAPEKISLMLADALGEEKLEALGLKEARPTSKSAPFLQEHQLGFMTLLNRGGGEVRGAVLDGAMSAAVVGYRLDQLAVDALQRTDSDLLMPDAIDLLPARDRVLIATAMSAPPLSIEVG